MQFAVLSQGLLQAALPWLSRLFALLTMLLLVGLMPEIAGIDPTQALLRARAGHQQLLTAEALQSVNEALQLQRSAPERLWDWFSAALRGDLGLSWVDGQSVLQHVYRSSQTSLLLMCVSLLLTIGFCVAGVVITFWRWQQNHLSLRHNTLSSVLISLPEYVIATLLILIFAIGLGWFPAYGWQGWSSIWLPSLALAIPASGLLSRLIHDSLNRVLLEPWVLTWLSANVRLWQIGRFALKRTLAQLLPQFAMVAIGLTGGAVAVEQIFAIPGIGQLLLGAAKAQDLPLLQGGLLVLLLFSMLVSSVALLLQRHVLGPTTDSGKLISSHQHFQFTQTTAKRWLSASLLGLLVFCALWALLRDPYTIAHPRLAPMSGALPFGADAVGRDLLARIGAGMFTTLKLGLIATALSLLLGLIMGIAHRYTQGVIEVTKAIPYIVAGLLVAGLTGMASYSAMLAIVLVSWAPLASHCTSLLTEAKAQPHAHLAPIWGNSRWRIWRYYLLPYLLPPLFRHALLRLPVITLSLTALSFIGLGAPPPSPQWGLLIAENLPYFERAPQAVLLPISGLIMLAIAINLLFDD